MTEQEWLDCTDPERMLDFLKGKASERKLRYFLIASARRVFPAKADKDMIEALAVAERFADGKESRYRLARIRSTLNEGHPARVGHWFPLYTNNIRSLPAWHATREKISRAAREGAACCAWSINRSGASDSVNSFAYPKGELIAQAGLLRDMFGNPFHSVDFDPSWIVWNGGTITRLAETIYGDRAFDRLPILADALVEAGCDNADVLNHCRGDGSHVRGCWVIDMLLGKE